MTKELTNRNNCVERIVPMRENIACAEQPRFRIDVGYNSVAVMYLAMYTCKWLVWRHVRLIYAFELCFVGECVTYALFGSVMADSRLFLAFIFRNTDESLRKYLSASGCHHDGYDAERVGERLFLLCKSIFPILRLTSSRFLTQMAKDCEKEERVNTFPNLIWALDDSQKTSSLRMLVPADGRAPLSL